MFVFCDFSSESGTVELDDEGGRTFLRVLIHLIMQDYAPLVSGSLQLIFKHFSQRAEVLQAFKQVRTKRTQKTLSKQRNMIHHFNRLTALVHGYILKNCEMCCADRESLAWILYL